MKFEKQMGWLLQGLRIRIGARLRLIRTFLRSSLERLGARTQIPWSETTVHPVTTISVSDGHPLSVDQKRLILYTAISSLVDQYFASRGTFPVGMDLPVFLNVIGADRRNILGILDARNRQLPWPLSSQVARYPTFWRDLWHNVQLERLPRSKRPQREVT